MEVGKLFSGGNEMDWQPIDTAPNDIPILVFGGTWQGEIGDDEPSNIAHVMRQYGSAFDVIGGSGYSSWVNSPTHWMPLPDPPSTTPPTQIFDNPADEPVNEWESGQLFDG